MADNVTLDAATTVGATIRTDDDGTAHWQYVKLAYGADDTYNIVTSTATNPLPVALSDTDNAVLDAMVTDLAAIEVLIGTTNTTLGTIDTDTGAMVTALQLIDNAVSGAGFNITQFAGAAVPIGAGLEATAVRVTLATDSTGVLSIDDNGGAITVDGTVTANLSATDNTVLDNIDSNTDFGAVVGGGVEATALRVTIASDSTGLLSIDDGGNTITVDGDVGVSSIVPGTAATNLGKAEDAAHTSGDTGVMALGVRNDDLATLAGADGDYAPLQVNSDGALFTTTSKSEYKQASGVAAGGAPGADDMVAAVADRYLVIHALALFATSATTNTVYVDNVDHDLIGNSGNGIPLSIDADGDTVAGFVLPFNPGGWAKTDAIFEAITLNTSAAQDIIYCITYSEVP